MAAKKMPKLRKDAPAGAARGSAHEENRRAAIAALHLDPARLARLPDPSGLPAAVVSAIESARAGGDLDFVPEARAVLELLERELAWWRASVDRIDREAWVTSELTAEVDALQNAVPAMRRALAVIRGARTFRNEAARDALLSMLRESASRMAALGGTVNDTRPTVDAIVLRLAETDADVAATLVPHAEQLAGVLVAWVAHVKRKGKARSTGHLKLFAATWKAATGETLTAAALQKATARTNRQ
jgi:hypothetical protein